MTNQEAGVRAAELNVREGGERHWFARRRADDSWEVVAVGGAPTRHPHPLTESLEARPEPPVAPDPRPSIARSVPPYAR